MGLKEKLKELLNKVDNSELDEDLISGKVDELSELVEEVSELVSDDSLEEAPKYISLDWGEVEELVVLQANLKQFREALSTMFLQFERRKNLLIKAIGESEAKTTEEVQKLRENYGLSEKIDYQLNLPLVEGEGGSFVIDLPEEPEEQAKGGE